MYILVQVWRWDDSLHVYHKAYDGYHKKVSEFEFKSKLYSACRLKNASKWDLEKCCFECVLTSYFIYTVTFKVVILDSFSRHNLWGDAHLVLRDILPDKDFDQWLAVCLNKEVRYFLGVHKLFNFLTAISLGDLSEVAFKR